MVLHSSGTTSAPKGIAHSSNTLRYATEGICKRWELSGDDVYLVICEFGFVGGLVFGYFPPLFKGATGVLVNRWKAERALELIEEHGCSYLLAMPTHSADLVAAARETPRDLSSLRALAAPGLTPERRVEMKDAFGLPPLGDYGLSEVPGHAAHGLDEPDEKIVRTEGRPYDGTEIRIVDSDENRCRPETVGAVIVNGPSRFLGFLNNDELTRESLTDWGGYRTGDLGALDEDGQFVYVGRSKDIIRRGGVTIVPAEVEPVILQPPGGARGRDRPAARRAARRARVRGDHRLARPDRADAAGDPGVPRPKGVAKYTWPESVEVFEDFPRTPSLKVVKRDLVQRILERSAVTA